MLALDGIYQQLSGLHPDWPELEDLKNEFEASEDERRAYIDEQEALLAVSTFQNFLSTFIRCKSNIFTVRLRPATKQQFSSRTSSWRKQRKLLILESVRFTNDPSPNRAWMTLFGLATSIG